MKHDRLVQLVMLALAAAALVGAAWLRGPIEEQRGRLGLDTVSADEAIAKHPRIALLQLVPGGIRAPFINYLWIRSQELKQDGKFFDAWGLRSLICEMTPHFPGVWAFLAWDMAWNISVATHTEAERWMWVSNGIKLIRNGTYTWFKSRHFSNTARIISNGAIRIHRHGDTNRCKHRNRCQ
ncbi:hypothetical protein LCGC14_2759800 [marine sediment metagenome]|uniref:Uncharacterized protein n=1 Tax=marine sediment metagenome TaxID=412755 RepID=A0A0F9BQU9_9ZZZZ